MAGWLKFPAFQWWFRIEHWLIIEGVIAIFVEKGNSQSPQTMGVCLLGGFVYYAEYSSTVNQLNLTASKLSFSVIVGNYLASAVY